MGDLENELSGDDNEYNRSLFLAHNIESDHDIISDYYFNQIEAEFTSSDNETGVLYYRNLFDKKIKSKFEINITHIDLINLFEDFKSPIFNENNQINNSIINLNSLLVESLNIKQLKKILKDYGLDDNKLKGKKGIKLFELFVEHLLKQENASAKVSPLFVLYDLRILAGHIKNESYVDQFNSCIERLELKGGATLLEVYKTLCLKLIEMYKSLI